MARTKKKRTEQAPEELDQEELERLEVEELPEREAMSVLPLGDPVDPASTILPPDLPDPIE